MLVRLSALLLLIGCSGGSAQSTPDAPLPLVDAPPPDAAQPDALSPPVIDRTQTEAELAPMRTACAFPAGAWPAQTIGKEIPVGADIPIKHVVVIMQENRSFDHYLGRLVAQGYYAAGDFSAGGTGFSHHDQIDGLPAGFSNPDGMGGTVVPHADDKFCYAVNHSWNDMHQDWDGGKNDGFVINNAPDGQKSFYYEDDTIIPFYYALANTFAVGDRYFCSALTSTWPNRLFLMAGTSFGIGDNSFVTIDTRQSPAPQIFSNLEAAGRTWKDYTDGPHQVSFFATFGFAITTQLHFGSVKCDLMNDIANDALPDVAFIMGDEVGAEYSDEGPSDLPGIGALMVENIVRAIMASPAWKDTVIFIAYDENGGLADHVPPADACAPDAYTPHDLNDRPFTGDFKTTGFRVPFIVVSPYARAHFASHATYDHTSITRFIEARFGLPALTARDANATPPMEMFDFDHPAFMTPPSISAHTVVDPAVLSSCAQTLAPMGCTP